MKIIMKKYTTIFLFGFVFLQVQAQKEALTKDEKFIKANFMKQEACWNGQDIECYMQAYSTTDEIQTISTGGVTFGYENIISDYKRYFPKGKMGNLYFDEFNFRKLSNKLYFVTGRFNLKFEGREKLVQGWFSVVMKKERGKWLIITDHSS